MGKKEFEDAIWGPGLPPATALEPDQVLVPHGFSLAFGEIRRVAPEDINDPNAKAEGASVPGWFLGFKANGLDVELDLDAPHPDYEDLPSFVFLLNAKQMQEIQASIASSFATHREYLQGGNSD